jgi:hypothetical protein
VSRVFADAFNHLAAGGIDSDSGDIGIERK